MSYIKILNTSSAKSHVKAALLTTKLFFQSANSKIYMKIECILASICML